MYLPVELLKGLPEAEWVDLPVEELRGFFLESVVLYDEKELYEILEKQNAHHFLQEIKEFRFKYKEEPHYPHALSIFRVVFEAMYSDNNLTHEEIVLPGVKVTRFNEYAGYRERVYGVYFDDFTKFTLVKCEVHRDIGVINIACYGPDVKKQMCYKLD